MDLEKLDLSISSFMRRWGILCLRLSLGVIFIWFWVLKPVGISPAEPLLLATVAWLPVVPGETWLIIIGCWEVAIGLAFLIPGLIRIGIGLLALQMVGTLLPLILLPEVTFQAGRYPYGPTMEGAIHHQESLDHLSRACSWRNSPQ